MSRRVFNFNAVFRTQTPYLWAKRFTGQKESHIMVYYCNTMVWENFCVHEYGIILFRHNGLNPSRQFKELPGPRGYLPPSREISKPFVNWVNFA